MSENGKDLVLEDKKELELSGDVNIGNGNANIVDEIETNDVNIGFNNVDNSDNKPKDNEIIDNNDEKKSDVEKNKNKDKDNSNSINKSADKDDNKYKVGENADKINEMAKRLCHFGFGLLFLLMYSICPLFFLFALGSFTMALVDDDIINDLINNKSSIIEFCSRFCMFPELVVSGTKRGILWGEGNMLTGLITGGKIEYTQNKGLIHSTIEGVLQAIVDEKKSAGKEKNIKHLDYKKQEDKKSILPNDKEKSKDAEENKDISIGCGNKIQSTTDNVKTTKVETYENQDVVKNSSNSFVSKSSSKSSEQTNDSSSSLSNTDVDTKSNDNFSVKDNVKDNVSIASFSESKSSKSYKHSLNSTSSSSAISSDNEKNSVKSHISSTSSSSAISSDNEKNSVKSYVSSTSSSSNTSDIKSENEQLKEFSSDFEASISDINSMSSSKSNILLNFGGK